VLQPLPSLKASRAYHADQMARLPEPYKTLHHGETYPVRLSAVLENTQQQVEMAIREDAAPVT
jgi:GMP synthase-like glutamine amidotransferase